MYNPNRRAKILESLLGKWQSETETDMITITFTEHISLTGEAFSLRDCKKSVQNSSDETFTLNFYWTNYDVLRVFYAENQCVVCFTENKMKIGFFKSDMTCKEIRSSDQVVIFTKI